MKKGLKVRVAVVDDQQLFRQGMIALLREFDGLHVMLEASNGQELLNHLRDSIALPHVILLDLQMPVMDGIQAAELVRVQYPDIKILILTMHTEEELIVYMIENGANGFLAKNEDIDVVVDAINSVHEIGYYFNDRVSQAIIKNMVKSQKIKPYFLKEANLTEIEKEVVKLICREFTNREIAEKLSISVRTVDHHRERILKKIGAKNVAGIVMYAMKHGITA